MKGSVKEERMNIHGIILDNILKNMKARFAHENKFQDLACKVNKVSFEDLEKNYNCFCGEVVFCLEKKN